jgi:hypothetical protein
VVGPWGRHDAPAWHGSAARQTDVRGVSTAGRRFARKVPRTSVAPARGWWHRRAGDRSCSGEAQLGTPGPCWCSVAPKDLSDRGALAEDLAPDRLGPHRGHTRATNDHIRADNTGRQWFGILPAHRSDLAIRPRSPARSGRCPIGSVAPPYPLGPAGHRLPSGQPARIRSGTAGTPRRLLSWSFSRSFHRPQLQPTRAHWPEAQPNLSCLDPT